MKTLGNAFIILAVAHFLGFVGFIGYLGGTDRLNRERLEEVRDIFMMSITEQAVIDEDEAAITEKEAAAQEILDRRDDPNTGAEDRSITYKKKDEILREKMERFERDIETMEDFIDQKLKELEAKRTALVAQEKAFRAEVERQRLLRDDQDFQTTMTFFKGMESSSQKDLLNEWLKKGKREFVLDILSALDKNTAQSLFQEFTTPEDLVLAADLLERLRERGFSIANDP